ncbi:3-deoxy-7-phosphoheptulonate synthase [Candidatus Nitrosacidococcus sp. I8]|uniref:3-deoxy-7-phosphoheptulonate synthase n=1 Tax=Candidatus Nitrosacidococcus sp. I8 TaxID=2942908 RepID=UPI002225F68A|nr:3-deoxy-7-phosphoheptulonate synthase [Candidatus Nitrosacidococcus sp. I8]CAH9018374.1 Phospho-2-dehydro-3-deoxyheptonate aldolase, Phe-sensitive [Candidatus Nitrosacidococcus sp. I8]
MNFPTENLRIKEIKELIPPAQLQAELPITHEAAATVYQTRQAIQKILKGEDDRLIVIIGPCSIHDPKAAWEYAKRLQQLKSELKDSLLVIMRVYFEKPRSTVGWKGFINDPHLNDSFQINEGLHLARKLLLDLASAGIPAATEFLDLISPQYVADSISWGAIGARTIESQVHRELASGLSCPVGFKNATNGSPDPAIAAILSASKPHHFLSVTREGHSAIVSTTGNSDCHLILRGGKTPNYDKESIDSTAKKLAKAELAPQVMIDCSHGNSGKDPKQQIQVAKNIASQIAAEDQRIIGAMLESHLISGRQDIVPGQPLTYGQSITDSCMGWEESADLLHELARSVERRREAKNTK